MNLVYLCLGGNIGQRESSMQLALSKIREQAGEIVVSSSLYETEAWGADHQQAYLNACIGIYTLLSAHQLIEVLLDIETQMGRQRTLTDRYEPRIMDIDILFFNQTIIHDKDLIVPHPRLHLRKFVLIPLTEIIPNYLHPVLNKPIFQLLNDCLDSSSVTLIK